MNPVEDSNPASRSLSKHNSGCEASAKDYVPRPTLSYTTFTSKEKKLLIVPLGLATITSPLTATIYLPLLPILRTHFNASAQSINLTLTVYIIFQALSPAVFGPLSDSLGRRPVYLITLSLYFVANLGLALNRHSYTILVCLRALQSLGASAAFSVSYGVVADVCVPSERGKMLGPVSMALNLGACAGPVIGGWVAHSSGSYEWVFWALVIVAAVLLIIIVFFLPETARQVVGNGCGRAQQRWWEASWLSLCVAWTRKHRTVTIESPRSAHPEAENPNHERVSLRKRFRIRNPLACLAIIFHRDTFLALWMHGSFYTIDYSLTATVPDIYQNIYNFNELQVGLAYLPRGVGIITGGFVNGKWMDHNYRTIAQQIGHSVDKVSGDDLNHFPIERARARGSFQLLVWSTATLVGYGWAVNKHANVAVPLILQFMQGFWGTCFYTIYNTLVVDIFPESPSTAAAAASVVRCGMAATGVAILQPLLDAVSYGWYFTTLALWSGLLGSTVVYMIKTNGMKWRMKRVLKDETTEMQT